MVSNFINEQKLIFLSKIKQMRESSVHLFKLAQGQLFISPIED